MYVRAAPTAGPAQGGPLSGRCGLGNGVALHTHLHGEVVLAQDKVGGGYFAGNGVLLKWRLNFIHGDSDFVELFTIPGISGADCAFSRFEKS